MLSVQAFGLGLYTSLHLKIIPILNITCAFPCMKRELKFHGTIFKYSCFYNPNKTVQIADREYLLSGHDSAVSEDSTCYEKDDGATGSFVVYVRLTCNKRRTKKIFLKILKQIHLILKMSPLFSKTVLLTRYLLLGSTQLQFLK